VARRPEEETSMSNRRRIFSLRPGRQVRAMVRVVVVTIGLCFAAAALAKVPITVSGLGLLRDRETRVSLEQLMNMRSADTVSANTIEDAAVIVNAALDQDGFQRPQIEIVATLVDGSIKRFSFDPTFSVPIPRPLEARAIAFQIKPCVRWRIAHVNITGLTILTVKEGQRYFRTDATLFVVARTNAYSKSQVNRSENALLDELKRRGYAEATVRADLATVDERSGAVTLKVDVHEGPRWTISGVEINSGEADDVTLPDHKIWVGKDWNGSLEQDIREQVRQSFYRAGYPDVGVNIAAEPAPESGRTRETAVVVTVVPEARITMGQVRFEGNVVTRQSVLKNRVRLKPGEPLNPIELEHARYRISRLGVFDSVDLRYEPENDTTRDPVFSLHEGPRYETNLLMGYGSYEQLRGGVEYRQMNILGLAHQSRLQLIQSMKSTRGEYTYTVPELFGEAIDGSAKLFGLQRKEIAFLRQEYGATLSLRHPIARLHGEATIGYTFQTLRNRNNGLATDVTDEKQVNVASLDFGLTTDRRDNPIRPHRGYHATAQLELASPNFGGAAEYPRLELSGAYHTPWSSSRWIHVGFSHGVITTLGATNDLDLPVNKRFYPGGDNSIRGYQAGEAAPRLADGRFIGAKSYMLLNLELEQALTPTWSLVAFGDTLGTATRLKDYPFRERLYSVGLGIRYQTIIGPIRLEYGRNINPRPADPPGTWQISIGYPF
jgi:outer membrane protein insertion porin family